MIRIHTCEFTHTDSYVIDQSYDFILMTWYSSYLSHPLNDLVLLLFITSAEVPSVLTQPLRGYLVLPTRLSIVGLLWRILFCPTNRTQLFLSCSGTHPSWRQAPLKKTHNKTLFCLPYIYNSTAIIDDMVHRHLLCTRGLQRILAFGKKRYGSTCNASKFTSVMPAHKSIGKKNYNAIEKNDQKYEPLMRHFEYLKNLGEVRATRVVATLVNGMPGHANPNDSINVTYLPISMGYRSCYKRYI